MKKLLLSVVSFSFLFWGCAEGPMGPQGISGPEGQPGINILGQVFEVTNVNLTAANNYRQYFDFNKPIEESDKILMYFLHEVDNGTDVWRLLPQTYFTSTGGTYIYNFDFTRNDFSVFLNGNVNLASLPNNSRNGLVFRAVVIPADFANKVNTNDYQAVIRGLNMQENNVVSLK